VKSTTSTQRILSLVNHVNIPESVAITQFCGSESINNGFNFQLDITNTSELENHFKLFDNIGIHLNNNDEEPAYFNGIIHAIRFNGIHDKQYQYTLHLQSWLQLLTHEYDCRIFQNKTVLDILNLILTPHQFPTVNTKHLNRTYPKIRYCTQYNESSYQFIKRILAEYKINFLFTHQSSQHDLLLFDDVNLNSRKDFSTGDPIAITTPIQSHTELTPQVYASNNYHYPNSDKNLQIKSNKTTTLKNIFSKPLEHYTFPGDHTQLAQGQTSTNDRIETDQQKTYAIKYSRSRGIQLNDVFNNSHQANNKLRIIKIIHDVKQSLTEKNSHNQNSSYYQATLHCINASLPLKPETQKKHIMQNAQIAVVEGPSDKTVFTDDQGRIKVRFYWDKSHSANTSSSLWVRVSQALAGNRWGTRFTPLVGTEVWVDFINGDPDQPIVTRQAYNALNIPPYASAESYYSGIKSPNLEPEQPSNEIRFCDQTNHEHIYLNAQRDLIQNANNNITFNVENDESHTILHGNHQTTVNNGHYTLNAKTLVLKNGENEINMSQQSITIKSPLIKIN
jgi:type VI secretion system secreted protein VgrG